MTDAERHALIGQAIEEHKTLKQTLACLAIKADRIQQAVADGLRLIKGETTGHMKDGALYIAKAPHSMTVKGCAWPSAEMIGEFVEERAVAEKRLDEITAQLRDLGMGEYA